MKRLPFALVLLPTVVLAASALRHFDLTASFVPAKKAGANAAVAVTFRPLDPDVKINESPAPRLKLDLAQTALVDRQAPASGQIADYDPLTARYLDLALPVVFPVALSPTAPRGPQTVKAQVVYFYCSKREAWCRRGTTDVEFQVTVP